jgi:cytochrome c oxidase subunit I+III
MAVAIPSGVQIAAFVATVLVGKVKLDVPMLFNLGGLAIFVLGGITGVMIALVPFDLQAHDTHFIVAHLHTVLIGGTLFPILGGVWYWYPLIDGKRLSERLGRIAFGLLMAGFFVTFGPMHFTGLLGMPRRVFTYSAALGIDELNLVSTVGSFLLGAGVLLMVIEVVRPKKNVPLSERNPWGAGTLDWLAEWPPDKPWGVRSIPEIDSRYPLWDQPNFVRDVDEGRFYLPDAEEGLRETIVTTTVDAKPIQVLRVADPSFLPMLSAFGVGGFFILATFKLYPLSLLSAAFGFCMIVAWLWTGTAKIPEKETKDCGRGLVLPLYVSGPASVGWWGMLVTELAFLTAFLSLVFGYFFFWTIHEDFPPPHIEDPDPLWLVGGLVAVGGAWGLCALAVRWNRQDRGGWYRGAVVAAIGLSLVGAGALMVAPWDLDPTIHSYPAIVWVMAGWPAIQAVLGAIMLVYCLARHLAGRMDARHDMDITNVLLFWHFVGTTTILAVLVLAGFPRLV